MHRDHCIACYSNDERFHLLRAFRCVKGFKGTCHFILLSFLQVKSFKKGTARFRPCCMSTTSDEFFIIL